MSFQNNKKDSLADYVQVNVRIERFYERFPQGRIITELVSWENGVVIMKAYAFRSAEDAQPAATGHAYEKEGSSFINATSAIENCETSAVGRALALLGFEVKKGPNGGGGIASFEEISNAKLNQQQALQASEKQIGYIRKLLKETAARKQRTEAEVQEALLEKLGAESLDKLTTVQATKAISVMAIKRGNE